MKHVNQAKLESKKRGVHCGIIGNDFPVRLIGNPREIQIQAADPNFDLFGAIRAAFDALSPIDQIDNT